MSALYSFMPGLLMEARVGIEHLGHIENTQVVDSQSARSASSSSTPKAL